MADGTVTGAVHPDTFSGPVLSHRFASAVSSHSFPTGKNYLGFLDEETEIKELSMCGSGSSQTSPGLQCRGSFPEATSVPQQVLRGPRTGPRWSRLDAMGGKHARMPRASWGGVEHQGQADSLTGGGQLRAGASGCA